MGHGVGQMGVMRGALRSYSGGDQPLPCVESENY